jgi:hypothetical protein
VETDYANYGCNLIPTLTVEIPLMLHVLLIELTIYYTSYNCLFGAAPTANRLWMFSARLQKRKNES